MEPHSKFKTVRKLFGRECDGCMCWCHWFACHLGKGEKRDFPGGPGAKTSPSNAGDVGLILGWGTKISQLAAKKPKHKTGNTVTSSIKTLKIVNIKKNFF